MNRGVQLIPMTGRWFGAVVLILVVLIWIGLRSATVRADDSLLGPLHASIRMPVVGARPLGFTTQLEIAEDSSAGYVPVRITVNAVGNLPADRRLVYRFQTTPGGQLPPQNGLTVDLPINVAQGTKSQRFVRYLPKWSAGQALDITVLEDGRVLEGYDAAIGSVLRANRPPLTLLQNEHLTDWVFISANDQPDAKIVARLREVLPPMFVPRVAINRTLDPAFGPTLQAIGQRSLPSDWRAYQRFDIIAIKTETLAKLPGKAEAFGAIRGWILNGGVIVILDAPSPRTVLDKLNFRWTDEISSTERINVVARDFYYHLGVEESSLKDRFRNLQPANAGPGLQTYPLDAAKAFQDELDQIAQTPRLSPEEWNETIWLQPAGAGYVIGIVEKYSGAALPTRAELTIAARTMSGRSSPTLRRGVDPLIGDGRFSRWLIPGVAQPPVYTFIGLLTSFVILVGPIAYRRTSKYGRSYLMFAIAPALALITTLAMFGYGIVSDGFGTVVRVRQVTWIDGRSGDAGERIRSTYFAGVRPGGGLRFPGNAEVIGYPQATGDSWEDHNQASPETIGRILIRDDSQIFDSSFLPSRQQRQFVVHQPRHKVGYLRLTGGRDGTAPNIESSFDFVLHKVVVRDRDGNYWFVENLTPGSTRVGDVVEQKAASKLLGKLYNDHRPISAVRETSRQRNRNYDRETFDVIANTNRQLGVRSIITEGLFEEWLQQNLQTLGEIPERHFVATADISPDVLAVPGCQPVSSVRYLLGTLR